ncbi:MAG: hypothetical protein PSV35_06325, partial [bacterium]|nr:hypothetical protein [bacterium]
MKKLITLLDTKVLCPFQMAYDVIEQLSETSLALIHKIFEPVCPLNSPTDWVNLDDSIGDLGAMRAFEMNDILVTLLRKQAITALEMHIKLGELPLTMDNFYSLLFLINSMESTEMKVLNRLNIIFYLNSEQMPQLNSLINKLPINKNVHLHCTETSSFNEHEEHNQLLILKKQHLLITQGLAFSNLNNQEIEGSSTQLGSLINYAWTCLKAGAYQLGCQVLDGVLQQSNIDLKVQEELFVQLQIIRFLSHQHHLVVSAPFPEKFAFINEERIRYLYFIKAFSATLTRNLELAETCFMKAHINSTMPITDEDSIYKLNLFALFNLMKGEVDTAFMLENKLYEQVKLHHGHIAAVNHVVLINIARLYKKIKCFEEASSFYQKAYEQINGGGFTLFDLINYEMDKAILAEARGQNTQALLSWSKVAMYWLTCPNPYALALRPRLVLCQEKVIDTLTPLSREKVAHFLFKKINGLSQLFPLKHGNLKSLNFNFILANTENNGDKTVYISNGLIIHAYQNKIDNPTRSLTQIEHDLQNVVSSYIGESMGISSTEKTLAIEIIHELQQPHSEGEAIAYALLSQCRSLFFNGSPINLN